MCGACQIAPAAPRVSETRALANACGDRGAGVPGVRGELGNSHLSHSQTVAEGAEGGAGPAAAETVDLRGLLAGEIEDLGVENWRERVDVVDEEEVLERARLEVRDHDRLALDLDLDVDEVRVVAALDREELVQRVVGKLRRHEQEARLQNHQRLRHRHRVEVAVPTATRTTQPPTSDTTPSQQMCIWV
eukprot:273189-Rhodomonas_salina.1